MELLKIVDDTINSEEAAKFFGVHKFTLVRWAREGRIPACKVGKEWRFIKQDLVAYMRADYTTDSAPQGVKLEEPQWHSINAVKRVSGILISSLNKERHQKEFARALEQIENRKPSKSTM